MTSDSLPESVKAPLRRIRRRMHSGGLAARDALVTPRLGPFVSDVSIADAYTITFQISSRERIDSVTAVVTRGDASERLALDELLRYRRDGRELLLAKLDVADRMVIGSSISLTSERGRIAVPAVAIRETSDSNYPLIDRLVLSADGGRLTVESGRPRTDTSPALLGVAWRDDEQAVVLEIDVDVTAGELSPRGAGNRFPVRAAGHEVLIPVEALKLLSPLPGDEPELIDVAVSAGVGHGPTRLRHPDPWVKVPREYQTFTPMQLSLAGRSISVRPYWTRGGFLSLKIRTVAP